MKKFILIILALLLLAVPCFGALEFNGTNQYVLCGNDSTLDSTDEFSYTAWFILGATGAERSVLTRNFGGGAQYGFRINADATGSFTVRTQTKGFWANSDETFSAGTEYFIGVSFSVANNHYYVVRNGTVIEEGTLSDESRAAITGDLNIGRDNRGQSYWDDKIWDVRIYQNKALSVDEMKIIYYSRGNDNMVDSLVGRWPMDEKPDGTAASGTNSVIDISGNGNHGTPYNSPVYRSAPVRLTNPQFN